MQVSCKCPHFLHKGIKNEDTGLIRSVQLGTRAVSGVIAFNYQMESSIQQKRWLRTKIVRGFREQTLM
jgi:hypothetical protein